MTAVWLTIVLVALASAALKAAGPLLLGDRQLGPRATAVITLLAPALLTALVLVDTVTAEQRLVVDARLAGVAAAGIALLLRAPVLLVLAVAVATTALLRLLAAEPPRGAPEDGNGRSAILGSCAVRPAAASSGSPTSWSRWASGCS